MDHKEQALALAGPLVGAEILFAIRDLSVLMTKKAATDDHTWVPSIKMKKITGNICYVLVLIASISLLYYKYDGSIRTLLNPLLGLGLATVWLVAFLWGDRRFFASSLILFICSFFGALIIA